MKTKREREQKGRKGDLRIGLGVDDLLGLEHDNRELLLPFLVLPGCQAVYFVRHSDRLVKF